MTLAKLRTKAYNVLTPLWQSIQTFENRYYTKNGTYKSIPIRKLHIPSADRFDVWARVVANDTGYSGQILVEFDGKQYARAQGYGTGTTFDWKEVSLGTLDTTGESYGPPNSFMVESNTNGGTVITY